MLKTLERYQTCTYKTSDPSAPSMETQNSYQEYLKLKGRVELLQHSQRHLLGENLEQLSSPEIDQLESQLEKSLKQIRSSKTQMMLDQLCDLKRKEQMLQDANRTLSRKLQEIGSENPFRLSWQNGDENGDGSSSQRNREPQPQNQGFFQPLGCEPPLQIGFNQVDHLNSGVTRNHNVNGFATGWM
ncbi:uncharacterized protein A4U43_C09F11420 [Asparagus officinalis]|uniref:K-box domain-containing protein n=1 Tax=Asparagus officinalis TaxID=4686 RepID=A0A5P1EA80_ASPOF|nr:uncharacterized protein A4U43_C09F11420 [Asparagus officinalis]